MSTALFSSLLAFIGTNIDDIIILMLFFSVSASEYDRMKVVLAQYSGLGLLFVFSLLVSAGIASIPVLKEKIARYRKVLVPVVFIALGLFIISDGILF